MSPNPSATPDSSLSRVVGDQRHGHRALAELLGVLLVEVALEVAHEVRRQSPLAALVHEIQRAAVGHKHADEPASRPCRRSRPSMPCSEWEARGAWESRAAAPTRQTAGGGGPPRGGGPEHRSRGERGAHSWRPSLRCVGLPPNRILGSGDFLSAARLVRNNEPAQRSHTRLVSKHGNATALGIIAPPAGPRGVPEAPPTGGLRSEKRLVPSVSAGGRLGEPGASRDRRGEHPASGARPYHTPRGREHRDHAWRGAEPLFSRGCLYTVAPRPARNGRSMK